MNKENLSNTNQKAVKDTINIPNMPNKNTNANNEKTSISYEPFFAGKNILIYLCMVLLLCCATFSYNALRILKDSFVNKYAPPVTLNFIKAYIMTPLTAIFPFALSALARFVPNSRNRFYYLIGFFLVAYLLVYLAFPYCEIIQTDAFRQKLKTLGLGDFGAGMGAMCGYWLFSIFYVTVEFWGMVGISMLAWGSINDLLPNISEVRKGQLYSSFTAISNVFSFLSALWVRDVSTYSKGLPFINRAKYLLGYLSLFSLTVMLLSYIILTRLVKKERVRSDRPKNTEVNGHALILSEKYYYCLAIMIAAYNICTMAIDSFAKPAMMESVGADKWSVFQGSAYALNSIASIFIAVLNIVVFKNMSIGARALLPVLMMGLTGSLFFFYYIIQGSSAMATLVFTTSLGVSAHHVIPLLIVEQLVGSKAAKYACSDPAKERFVAEILPVYRYVIKGIIDTFYNRVPKSACSLFVTFLLFCVSFYDMNLTQKLNTLAFIVPLGISITLGILAISCKGRALLKKYYYSTLALSLSLGVFYVYKGIGLVYRSTAVTHTHHEHHHVNNGEPAAEPALHRTRSSGGKKKKSDINRIAPVMFVLFLLTSILWGWSIMAIYPLYQARIGQKQTGITIRELLIMISATLFVLVLTWIFVSDFLDACAVIKTHLPSWLRMTNGLKKIGIDAAKLLVIEGA